MAAHRFWRVNCTANCSNSTSNIVGFSELEFRSSIGGVDQTGSGTASASSVDFSNVAANAFDNNTGTTWFSGGGALPQWIQYDFGVGITQDIVEFAAKAPTSPQFTPRDFQLQWSDNGSTWTTLITVNCETNWLGTSTFTVWNSDTRCDVGADGQMWRINMTAQQSGATTFGVTEVEMQSIPGGADEIDFGYGFASSMENTLTQGAFAAFDDVRTGSSGWQAFDTGEIPSFLIYKFPTAPVEIVEVSIQAWISPANANAPADFTIDRWNGTTWVTKYTATGLTWGSQEIKIFSFGPTASNRPTVFVAM